MTATTPYEKERAIINGGCYIFSYYHYLSTIDAIDLLIPSNFELQKQRSLYLLWRPKKAVSAAEVLIGLAPFQVAVPLAHQMFESISLSHTAKDHFPPLAAYLELTIREVTIAYD